MREAILYKKLKIKKHAPHRDEVSGAGVQCRNCAHYCVILPGKRGVCGVRENIDGKLYALNYGKAIACHVDPIEKKPFFHFLPGSYSLSVATIGCNFSCKNCQNWDISQAPKITGRVDEAIASSPRFANARVIEGEDVSPEEIVEMAKKYKVPSISYTYTDPVVFSEYALKQ